MGQSNDNVPREFGGGGAVKIQHVASVKSSFCTEAVNHMRCNPLKQNSNQWLTH
jgi:hypothetical protein